MFVKADNNEGNDLRQHHFSMANWHFRTLMRMNQPHFLPPVSQSSRTFHDNFFTNQHPASVPRLFFWIFYPFKDMNSYSWWCIPKYLLQMGNSKKRSSGDQYDGSLNIVWKWRDNRYTQSESLTSNLFELNHIFTFQLYTVDWYGNGKIFSFDSD
jgi:hypothetical protein